VDADEPRAQDPEVVEVAHRREPVASLDLLALGAVLGDVDVERHAGFLRHHRRGADHLR
jgi:hypothetical protein